MSEFQAARPISQYIHKTQNTENSIKTRESKNDKNVIKNKN